MIIVDEALIQGTLMLWPKGCKATTESGVVEEKLNGLGLHIGFHVREYDEDAFFVASILKLADGEMSVTPEAEIPEVEPETVKIFAV